MSDFWEAGEKSPFASRAAVPGSRSRRW